MTQPLTTQRQREHLAQAVSYSPGVGVTTPPQVDSHIADTPIHRRVWSVTVAFDLPVGAERRMLFRTDKELTFNEVRSVVRGSAGPSVTWNVEWALDLTGLEQAAFTGAGNQVTTSTTTGASHLPDTNPIPAGAWIWFVTTAVAGTVTEFAATLYFEETGN